MSKSLNYRATAESCAADLVASGLVSDHERALMIGLSVMDTVRTNLGGSELYIPKRQSFIERAARDESILRQWNGRNTAELCVEFGLARRTLYSIAERHRKKQKTY